MSLSISLTSSGSHLVVSAETGHTITVPANANGMRFLVEILEAQRDERSTRLGSKAKPTQSQVDDFFRRGGTLTRLDESGKPKPLKEETISIEELLAFEAELERKK